MPNAKETMSAAEMMKLFAFMVIGMAVTTFGLAVSVKAELGIPPISTLPCALSQIFPSLSLGIFTIGMYLMFFLLTLILLNKEFKLFQLLLLP